MIDALLVLRIEQNNFLIHLFVCKNEQLYGYFDLIYSVLAKIFELELFDY
jgi:hypothetical protein